MPLIFVGLLEDLIRLHYSIRLFFIAFSATIAVIFLDIVIRNIGIFELPYPIAVLFTIFSIIGVTSAFNIIDGLNGLASGIALISLAAFYYVANRYDLTQIEQIIVILLLSILGFFVINFPLGKIFLGDSGSYFIGFSLAIISILLVNESKNISPWFPLVVLFIPIWETLFSIYRRIKTKGNPFTPDRFHMHQLVYKLVKNNSLSSLLILIVQIIITFIAILVHNSLSLLIFLFMLFIIIYTVIYKFLIYKTCYN